MVQPSYSQITRPGGGLKCLTIESKTNKQTHKQFLPYRQFVNSWPMKNLAELADGPAVYAGCQGQAICCVRSANPLLLSIYKKLALSLPPDNFTSPKLTNVLLHLTISFVICLSVCLSRYAQRAELSCIEMTKQVGLRYTKKGLTNALLHPEKKCYQQTITCLKVSSCSRPFTETIHAMCRNVEITKRRKVFWASNWSTFILRDQRRLNNMAY